MVLISSYGRFHSIQTIKALSELEVSVKGFISDKQLLLNKFNYSTEFLILSKLLSLLHLWGNLSKRYLNFYYVDKFCYLMHDVFCCLYILLNRKKIKVYIGYSLYCYFSLKMCKFFHIKSYVERAGSHPLWQRKVVLSEYDYLNEPVPSSLLFYLNQFPRMKKELDIADSVLTCSNYAKKSMVMEGLQPDKIKKIYLGANFFNSDIKVSNFEKEFKLIFVGSQPIIKGLVYFLDLVRLLEKSGFQINVLIVSNCSKFIFDKYKDIFSLDYVKYTPSMNQRQLALEYQAASLTICPSIDDAFNMVTLESVRSGTPVVTFDTVGASEVISSANVGVVVKSKSVNDLYSAVTYFIENQNELAKIKKNCLKENFDFSWSTYAVNLKKELFGNE